LTQHAKKLIAANFKLQKLATGNWQLATGNWQLATGNWQLATGNWQLAKSFETLGQENNRPSYNR
jgi:hypothetical protein